VTETAGSRENQNDMTTSRSADVFHLERERIANNIRKQTMRAGDILSSLSPLTNSMRLFGLYFDTCNRAESHAKLGETTIGDRRRVGGWNFARIYATLMLVVASLNAVRQLLIFDGEETLGAGLFMKLALIPAIVLNFVMHATYYAACHTANLQRVFLQVRISEVCLSVCFALCGAADTQ